VGNVIQGTNVSAVVAGYQLVSSIPPISGGVGSTFGYTPANLDRVWIWNPVSQGYSFKTYTSATATWTGGEPTFNVGDAFFLQAKVATNWVQTFTVQ